jgi:hypothetical protein
MRDDFTQAPRVETNSYLFTASDEFKKENFFKYFSNYFSGGTLSYSNTTS